MLINSSASNTVTTHGFDDGRGTVGSAVNGPVGWLANTGSNAFYAPFAAPWNVAGWPAMSVPTGNDSAGTPLAVQLVGPPGSESTLLAVARQLETAQPWRRVAPAFAND